MDHSDGLPDEEGLARSEIRESSSSTSLCSKHSVFLPDGSPTEKSGRHMLDSVRQRLNSAHLASGGMKFIRRLSTGKFASDSDEERAKRASAKSNKQKTAVPREHTRTIADSFERLSTQTSDSEMAVSSVDSGGLHRSAECPSEEEAQLTSTSSESSSRSRTSGSPSNPAMNAVNKYKAILTKHARSSTVGTGQPLAADGSEHVFDRGGRKSVKKSGSLLNLLKKSSSSTDLTVDSKDVHVVPVGIVKQRCATILQENSSSQLSQSETQAPSLEKSTIRLWGPKKAASTSVPAQTEPSSTAKDEILPTSSCRAPTAATDQASSPTASEDVPQLQTLAASSAPRGRVYGSSSSTSVHEPASSRAPPEGQKSPLTPRRSFSYRLVSSLPRGMVRESSSTASLLDRHSSPPCSSLLSSAKNSSSPTSPELKLPAQQTSIFVDDPHPSLTAGRKRSSTSLTSEDAPRQSDNNSPASALRRSLPDVFGTDAALASHTYAVPIGEVLQDLDSRRKQPPPELDGASHSVRNNQMLHCSDPAVQSLGRSPLYSEVGNAAPALSRNEQLARSQEDLRYTPLGRRSIRRRNLNSLSLSQPRDPSPCGAREESRLPFKELPAPPARSASSSRDAGTPTASHQSPMGRPGLSTPLVLHGGNTYSSSPGAATPTQPAPALPVDRDSSQQNMNIYTTSPSRSQPSPTPIPRSSSVSSPNRPPKKPPRTPSSRLRPPGMQPNSIDGESSNGHQHDAAPPGVAASRSLTSLHTLLTPGLSPLPPMPPSPDYLG